MLTLQGNFTKALVELSPGKLISGAGSYISFDEWCDTFGKVKIVNDDKKMTVKQSLIPYRNYIHICNVYNNITLGYIF